MRLFDIKTNIIPRVDPNCESISQSLSLLREFKNRNVHKVCSAPNYFDVENYQIKEIIIGTNNKGKYREICDLLPNQLKKYSSNV